MAGLFGLFYTMFSIGVKGVGAVNDKIEDKNNKIKYHDEETDTYLDHRMVRRNMNNNHRMRIEKKGSEIFLKDLDTNEYTKNLTADRNEKEYQRMREMAKNGRTERTHIRYGEDEHRNEIYPGYRYKDLKTGKVYFTRYMTFWKEELKGLSLPNFYGKSLSLYLLFDFNTKLPVRFTDRSIETIIGAYKGSIETVDKLFLLFKEDAIKEKEENYKKYNDRLKDMYTMRSRLEETLQDSVDAGMFITNIMNDRGK